MAEPIIIVKENGLVIEVKFKGDEDPGPLEPDTGNPKHVILRWRENQWSSSEVVVQKAKETAQTAP